MPAILCENQLDNNIAQYKFKQKNSVLSNKNVQKWSYTQITKKASIATCTMALATMQLKIHMMSCM